jgi:hypothetical protein
MGLRLFGELPQCHCGHLVGHVTADCRFSFASGTMLHRTRCFSWSDPVHELQRGDRRLVRRRRRPYPRAMRIALTRGIDRRLERLAVARARRRAPMLRLVPARWIVVATRPTVLRVRRSLSPHALAVGAAIAVLLAALLTV